MRLLRIFTLLIASVIISGCHVSSRTAVGGGGGSIAYNETLQKTTNEQMLLNLVRLRYVDFPFFLDVNAITTQFSIGTKLKPTIPVPGFSERNPGKLEGEWSWLNTPTISYTPMQGQTFALQLFRPIDLLLIQQLIYAGWDIDRVFRLCIQSIDDIPNAPTASGPMPDYEPKYKNFLKLSKLLRYFQRRSELQVSVKLSENTETVFKGQALKIFFPMEGEQSKLLYDMLRGLNKEENFYSYQVGVGFNKARNIGIMPRSLMATMYYLSLGVQIPKGCKEQQCVAYAVGEEGKSFDWKELVGDLLTVNNSTTKPKNAFVSVKYRGHWFYIHEHDLQSKRTFVLLLQLYNLQSNTTTSNAPLLTLPLN